MATKDSAVCKGSRVFDYLYDEVVEDLKLYHGADFQENLLTWDVQRPSPSEMQLTILYNGIPALTQSLDLFLDRWTLQFKRWSAIH